jgi:hypothetical protein
MSVRNVVTRERLEDMDACFEAKEWFAREFLGTATVSAVLRAAAKHNRPWVSFYIEHASTKASSKALDKFATDLAISIITKTVGKNKEDLKLILGTIKKLKEGKIDRFSAIYSDKALLYSIPSILNMLNDLFISKRDKDFEEVASDAMWVVATCDDRLNKGKYINMNKAIALFNSFPQRKLV